MAADNERTIKFYTEIVSVTVLSLIAANIWIKISYELLNRYFPGQILHQTIVAMLITLAIVFILYYSFAYFNNDSNNSTEDNSTNKYDAEAKYGTALPTMSNYYEIFKYY